MSKLNERIESYQELSNYKLMTKVPVIYKINGKNFSNATAILDKPFDKSFYDCLSSTAKLLCSEIEGATVGYVFNDTIIVISRNDQTPQTEPWFNNNLSKLISVSTSLAASHFYQCADFVKLQLSGGYPVFSSNVFTVPNNQEAINTLIYYQQLNSLIAVQFASYYELLKKYNKNDIKKMLYGLSRLDKIELLKDEFSIDFNDYSSVFRNGALCIKINNKWVMSEVIEQFSLSQDYLKTII